MNGNLDQEGEAISVALPPREQRTAQTICEPCAGGNHRQCLGGTCECDAFSGSPVTSQDDEQIGPPDLRALITKWRATPFVRGNSERWIAAHRKCADELEAALKDPR